ncbi:hypothetical protein [Luteimonas sp. SDU82]|uniref:hypothetical protein n=1 Tax=Luteimonas sp. SDU82 TaxID=3422592 RepID=UPI003EBD5776
MASAKQERLEQESEATEGYQTVSFDPRLYSREPGVPVVSLEGNFSAADLRRIIDALENP